MVSYLRVTPRACVVFVKASDSTDIFMLTVFVVVLCFLDFQPRVHSKTVINPGPFCLSARECEPQVLHNNTAADAQLLPSVTHSP